PAKGALIVEAAQFSHSLQRHVALFKHSPCCVHRSNTGAAFAEAPNTRQKKSPLPWERDASQICVAISFKKLDIAFSSRR
ncbi:hypothetical protein ACC736_37515, partial [Rhizobium ruizarguesonis]